MRSPAHIFSGAPLEGIGNSVDVAPKFWSEVEELVYGFKALTQEHIEVVPKTVKEGNFAGFLLDLLEHIPDGTLRGLLLQEVGQHAIAHKGLGYRKDLGGKGAALFLAEAEALFCFFEKDLNGPA